MKDPSAIRLDDAHPVEEPPPRRPSRRVPIAIAVVVAGVVVAGVLIRVVRPDERLSSPRPTVVPESPATAMNLLSRSASNSPVLVADPTDARFVVLAHRFDAPDYGCALQVSGDGGATWVQADPLTDLPPGAEKCYAPEVAFDREGVLHYLFVGLSGAGNRPMGAFVSTSSDRARTFTPPRQVLGANRFAVRMAIDPEIGRQGRMHLAWIEAGTEPALGGFGAGPNPIRTAFSDDGGSTFSVPLQLSDPSRRVVAPALVLGPDRHVHVAYYDLGDDARDYQGLAGPVWEGRWSVLLSTSSNGGRTFAPATVADSEIAPAERVMLIFTMAPPSVAVHESRVCLAWTDARNGDADAMARCSTDSGRRWAPLRRLNDDPVDNGRAQYLPRLATAPNGRLDAVFYDRREDPENRRNHVFFTSSDDGGAHFSPNVRLTDKMSDSRIGQQYVGAAAEGQIEIGSRLGLVSTNGGAVAAWTDTRYSLDKTTGQDIFTGGVRLGGSGAEEAGVPEKPLPAEPPIVEVGMTEQRFEFDPTIPAGRAVFRAVNHGQEDHELVLFPLPDDFPPIDVQLRGTERRVIKPLGRVTELAPGTSGTFAVNLRPNTRYALICFVRGADGTPHSQKGMSGEFRATPPSE